MALIRWQPFPEIDSLQQQMNHLFDNLLTTDGDGWTTTFAPAAEMQETPDTIYLKLEVPGLEPQDIDLHVSAETVSISGERKQEIHTEDKGTQRSEFRYGSFRRVISLPTRVQNTQVHAEYKNGILHLTLPKAEEEKNKVVKVNIG